MNSTPSSRRAACGIATAFSKLPRSIQRVLPGGVNRDRHHTARLARMPLDEELRICLACLKTAPERFPSAAGAWHARWSAAAPRLTLAASLVALEAVQALAGPRTRSAAEVLRALSTRHGLDDVAAVLAAYDTTSDQERSRPSRPTTGDPVAG